MQTDLVTGGAGFIGSHLVEALLAQGRRVRVLDDFSTGSPANLPTTGEALEVITGSVADADCVRAAVEGVARIFHLAALPSVPRSIEHPWPSHDAIANGGLQVLLAARAAGVRRVVMASSSSVYGDADTYPVDEAQVLAPISPYAVMKANNEHYAEVFSALYGMDIVRLRYFNVFGPRQMPGSAYAAAIPIFVEAMRRGESPPIYGDGTQSRDFTFVENVVQANIAAGDAPGAIAGAYNIAGGESISLLRVLDALNAILGTQLPPRFLPRRPGDIQVSFARIDRARDTFGYTPVVSVEEGLRRTVAWFTEAMVDDGSPLPATD